MSTTIPKTQFAVQLVGPNELVLNRNKPVNMPEGHQILLKVESTGLCFSDLKLLKQFSEHPRKTEIVSGLPKEEMDAIPSYVPGTKPTVPGHETCGVIVAIGDKVQNHKVGERCLLQTDYRAFKTVGGSNAAFGYNFEGGLQEYVIIDERISKDPVTGERFLIPAGSRRSASAVCLSEPWACVEDSYVTEERQSVLPGGKLLLVVDANREPKGIESLIGKTEFQSVTVVAPDNAACSSIRRLAPDAETAESLSSLAGRVFDDIIYFGSDRETIEKISPLLGVRGIANLVLAGKPIGSPASIGVGRIHYGMTRWIGTMSGEADESYTMIPATGELRPNDRYLVAGAGGPMGQMHVIRNICAGIPGVSVVATDFDDARLKSLSRLAIPLSQKNSVRLDIINPASQEVKGPFSYAAIMVPVVALVQKAIEDATASSIVNIFAGIPAPTIAEIDLDSIIQKRCFVFGTSGSTLYDMKAVLQKVEDGSLDTNTSVDAICGLAGAIEGIAAVENRTMAGKIIVYPQLRDMGLIPLSHLESVSPSAAAALSGGIWTLDAENALLGKS